VHLTLDPSLLSLVLAANLQFQFDHQPIVFPQPHTPHVTLYLTKFPSSSLQSVLAAVRDAFTEPSFKSSCFSNFSAAVVIGNYSMLPLNATDCLRTMSDLVVERTYQFALDNQSIPKWVLLLPEPDRSLKLAMFKQYASPNVFSQYDPHITVACSPNVSALDVATRALPVFSLPFVPFQIRVSETGDCGTVLSNRTFLSLDIICCASPASPSCANGMPSALSDSASIFLNGVACSQEKVAPAASKLNLRVLLTSFASALFAGVVAALATFAVEKLGGVKGGILAATPTTILPALVGIKNNSSSFDDFAASVWILPVGALCNSIFLASWRYGPPLLPRRWTVPHKCVSPCALNHHFYYSVFGYS
jgi:hypothetical protein